MQRKLMLIDVRKKVFQNRETTWRQRQKWDKFSLETRNVRSYQEDHHHQRLDPPLDSAQWKQPCDTQASV